MRARILLLGTVLALSACTATAPAPAPASPTPDRDAQLQEVTTAIAAVAQAQAEVDPLVASALAGVREVDLLVSRLRDPATVDEAKDGWPRVSSAVEAVDTTPLRPALRELAFAVDHARAELAAARADAPTEWESGYLTAEDRALVAMRSYAEETDALVQVIERHWPTYRAIAELTGPFLERRWVYRSSEEAAAAYEVELAPHLADLVQAQEEIAAFRERRDEAATAVNEAEAAASRRFRDRPRPTPTP